MGQEIDHSRKTFRNAPLNHKQAILLLQMRGPIINIVKNGTGASSNEEITSYHTRLNSYPYF